MESKSISGSSSVPGMSSMPDRCRACVAVRGGHVNVTTNIDLYCMKYKGTLTFGSGIFSNIM